MAESIKILILERDGEDGLIVTFSDGTTAGYVTEELLELRPLTPPNTASLAANSPFPLPTQRRPSESRPT
jgi:hypothetical protein